MKLLACLPLLILSVTAVAQEVPPVKSDVGLTTEAAADAIVLTDGMPLVLRNNAPLSSKVCHVGDVLKFEVAKPMIASDLVVIAKGATATLRVTAAEPAHRRGKGGRLEVTFESVELVNGQTVPLHGTVSFKAGGQLEMVGDMLTAG